MTKSTIAEKRAKNSHANRTSPCFVPYNQLMSAVDKYKSSGTPAAAARRSSHNGRLPLCAGGAGAGQSVQEPINSTITYHKLRQLGVALCDHHDFRPVLMAQQTQFAMYINSI